MDDDTNRSGPQTLDHPILTMTSAEFDEWLAREDEDPPPPSAYSLGCDGGRRGFLEAYIWRGEAALFESVNHIWNSLNAPKGAHCTLIGFMAGTGGTGRCALIRFLRKALREALDDGLVQPSSGYATIDAFHAASLDYFEASYSHYEKAVAKYAAILNGEPCQPLQTSVLLNGPWKMPDRQSCAGRSDDHSHT